MRTLGSEGTGHWMGGPQVQRGMQHQLGVPGSEVDALGWGTLSSEGGMQHQVSDPRSERGVPSSCKCQWFPQEAQPCSREERCPEG